MRHPGKEAGTQTVDPIVLVLYAPGKGAGGGKDRAFWREAPPGCRRLLLGATGELGATRVLNHGTDEQERSWLVRERVFDVFPRGPQADRKRLVEVIFRIHPNADVSIVMLPDPTFDNVRWGYTRAHTEPRWILIDP
jgi:hypothetical protein